MRRRSANGVTDMFQRSLPEQIVSELRAIDWLEPWSCCWLEKKEMAETFESELRNELCQAHALFPFRRTARAIAKRDDCDDVLFFLPDAKEQFAVVHLTWSMRRESDPTWPKTTFLQSLSDFVAHELIPTHHDWSES